MSSKVEKSKKKQSKADSAAITVASLDETYKKVMSSLMPSIEEHVSSEEYSASKDSLDFLSAKNSLLLSYLIDLVQLVRLVEKKKKLAQKKKANTGTNESDSDCDDEAAEMAKSIKSCLARLNEMKVALDKIRPLEKKMRYQLDRLLAAASSATSFAAGGEESEDEENGGEDVNPSANADPLSFRPNLEMMGSDHDDGEDGQEDSDNDDEPSDDDDNSDDDDEDLRAAKAVARAGSSKSSKKRGSVGRDDSDDDDGRKNAIYQPPRLAAVPFAEREKAEEKAERALARQRRRMRQSELLQTLRAADGTDRPEEEDLDGGAALGKQKEAARRMAEREAEKTKFEEEMMVRLTQSRKEKKARGRMMREEQSNLGAIADLGRLAAGVADAFGGSDDGGDSDGGGGGLAGMVGGGSSGRYENGKRRRGGDDYAEIHGERRRRKTGMKGSNAHQRALYGTENKKKKSKKSKR